MSGLSELATGAPVPRLSTRLQRAALHATAAFRAAPPFDEDRGLARAALGDASIQPGAPIGPHAALDLMAGGAVLAFHLHEFAASPKFVPAELTHYISRP